MDVTASAKSIKDREERDAEIEYNMNRKIHEGDQKIATQLSAVKKEIDVMRTESQRHQTAWEQDIENNMNRLHESDSIWDEIGTLIKIEIREQWEKEVRTITGDASAQQQQQTSVSPAILQAVQDQIQPFQDQLDQEQIHRRTQEIRAEPQRLIVDMLGRPLSNLEDDLGRNLNKTEELTGANTQLGQDLQRVIANFRKDFDDLKKQSKELQKQIGMKKDCTCDKSTSMVTVPATEPQYIENIPRPSEIPGAGSLGVAATTAATSSVENIPAPTTAISDPQTPRTTLEIPASVLSGLNNDDGTSATAELPAAPNTSHPVEVTPHQTVDFPETEPLGVNEDESGDSLIEHGAESAAAASQSQHSLARSEFLDFRGQGSLLDNQVEEVEKSGDSPHMQVPVNSQPAADPIAEQNIQDIADSERVLEEEQREKRVNRPEIHEDQSARAVFPEHLLEDETDHFGE